MSFILDFPLIIQVALVICVFGLISTFIVLVIIYLNRLKFIIVKRRERIALNTILKELSDNVLMYNAVEEIPKGELVQAIYNLSKRQRASFTFKKMLLNTLLHFSVNLNDTSTSLMQLMYQLLGLKSFSLKKLRSTHWFIRIEGINEIGKMNDTASISKIVKLTSDKNLDVRIKAYATLIEINAPSAFDLLIKEQSQLSEWHQIFLLDAMEKLSISTIPEFRLYLAVSQKSIIHLSVKAIIHFKQFSAISQMIALLDHEDGHLRNQVIRALGLLNASTAEAKLKSIYTNESEKNRVQILLALGDIASGESVDFIINEFLNTDNHQIVKAAMYAINSHTEELKNKSAITLFHLREYQKKVVKHFQQPINFHGTY